VTVIAANLEQMACDAMFADNFVDFPSPKIRAFRGSIYGGAGDADALCLFWEWLFDGRKKKKPVAPDEMKNIGDFTVMELNENGIFVWGAQFLPMPVSRKVHAIGAGGQAAVTAMILGKTPAEACDIACDVTPSTCARPISTYDLIDAQKAARKRTVARKR
jgi:hypothetical protein